MSDAHRASRREQILDAALRRIVRQGFHRTSMADIIEESGLSAGAIYLHFDSKQRIAIEAARRLLAGRLAEVEGETAGAPAPSPVAVMRALVAAVSREVGDTRLVVQLWGEAVADPDMRELTDGLFATLRDSFMPHLERWAGQALGLAPAAARDWAVRTVPVLLGLGQGYLLQRALAPDFDGEGYLTRAEELLR